MNKSDKCSKTQIGRKVIHKNDEEKRVYSYELDNFLSQGWELGVSDKHRSNNSKSKKGRETSNKGKKLSDETKEKISKSLQGNIPWNKGLTASTDDRVKYNCLHTHETNMRKYGCSFPNNPMTEEHKRKIGNANRNSHPKPLSKEQLQHKLKKQYETRKKNNTFNTSNVEENFYTSLIEEYSGKTILRNYKCERYPFYCDYYIVEDDLFIELNAHWTHGGMPFDENNPKCIEQLNIWKEKAVQSKFYQNAIETWTIRDVKKIKCAKENNLNYKVIY